MFLQFTPAYGFAFLQSGILPRAVFHKPPGRKTRCGKRTQTVVFHTGKSCCTRAAASPSQSPSVPALPKGEPLAVHANFISLPRPLPLGEVDANAVSRRRGRGCLRKGKLPRQRARPLRQSLPALPPLPKGEALAKPKALRFVRKLSRDAKGVPLGELARSA